MNHQQILDCYRPVLEDAALAYDLTPTDGVTLLRYVLVERCQVGMARTVWITTYATKREAGEYHATQEHPEDWQIEVLYDTKTGRKYDGIETVDVRWVEVQ